MIRDSGFDDKEFNATPYLKLIKDKEGTTCMCYQIRVHGKLHFVKKIRPEFENDSRMRAAFRKENEIGFSLSHPNIARYVFMEGIFSPEKYVVTEWIEGNSLDKFIENNPKYFSDRKNIKRFIYQLTDALDYLHQNGIIHGDLKPSNIMLSRYGNRVVLLDLGYSKSDAHTLTGGYTYDFAAPELMKGELSTEATDYYSLGKIVEFIKKNTEAELPKEILGLKEKLTISDESGRIHNKEEIYRILEKKNGKWVWLTGLPLVGLLVWFIMDIVNKDSSYQTDAVINQQPIIKEEIIKAQSFITDIESFETEEPIYKKNNKNQIDKTDIPKINIESEKEKIKEEVNRLLELNYTPHINRLDSLTQENIFTKDWYFKIINDSGEAMGNSIKDSYYYEKYPLVPKDEIIYILSTEFKDFSENIWQPKLDSYRKNIH